MFCYLILLLNPGLVVFPLVLAIIGYAFFSYTSKPQAIAQFGKLRNKIKQKREEYLKRRDKHRLKMQMQTKFLYPAALKASQISKAKMIHKEMDALTRQRVGNSSSWKNTNNESKDIEKMKEEIKQFVNSSEKSKAIIQSPSNTIQSPSNTIQSPSNNNTLSFIWNDENDDDDDIVQDESKQDKNDNIKENDDRPPSNSTIVVKEKSTGFLSIFDDDDDY